MDDRPSSWAVGWALFAAIMLMIAGMFQVIAGIAAIAEDEILVVGREWAFSLDITAWGWIHLLVGAVLILAGAGILTGNLAARILGVVVAGVSAVANFAFLPYYPVWAIAVIAVDIAIIWALTAHGRDAATVQSALD
jgi:hypothetical protein